MRYPNTLKVSAVSPALLPAQVEENLRLLCEAMDAAAAEGIDLLVTPELGLTGYTCGDLFSQDLLLAQAEQALLQLAAHSTRHPALTTVVGCPLRYGQHRFNCGVVVRDGELLGAVPKRVLPNRGEFYEKRWFSPGGVLDGEQAYLTLGDSLVPLGRQVFRIHLAVPGREEADWAFEPENKIDSYMLGVEICEDLWSPAPPSVEAALSGAEVLVNLSASPDLAAKSQYRVDLVSQQSARLHAAYVYCSSGPTESTTDLVFGGHRLIACDGRVLAEEHRLGFHKRDRKPCTALISLGELRHARQQSDGFALARPQSLPVSVDQQLEWQDFDRTGQPLVGPDHGRYLPAPNPLPFVPQSAEKQEQRWEEILQIQATGLARRLLHIRGQELVIGISGGLDSTLALLVASRALDLLELNPPGLICVTMPGFGTTDQTYRNACRLVELLHGTLLEIPIRDSVLQHFKDIGHDPAQHDVTYENAQARERTQILMDLANKRGALVVGTGDLSELALGWCTYNGDHMSMYGVNASIPKTLVSHLVRWCSVQARRGGETELADVLEAILDTPISPELLPPDASGKIQQLTESTTGPYILHDFFLYHTLRYGREPAEVYFLACEAFAKGGTPEVPAFDRETILHWLRQFYRRFFSQQFKRSCLPDGPKVGSVSLSPRGDWRMPSDASATLWLTAVEKLKA